MNRYVVKNLIIHSLIVGAMFGILAVIPFLGIFALFCIMLLTSPIVMLYLIMAGKYDVTDVKDSIIAGATVGFSSNITFAGIYCITIVILYLLFGYNPNFFLTAMIIHSPIWLLVVCIIFVGVVTATSNAFSGFLTHYIINFIRDSYANKHGG